MSGFFSSALFFCSVIHVNAYVSTLCPFIAKKSAIIWLYLRLLTIHLLIDIQVVSSLLAVISRTTVNINVQVFVFILWYKYFRAQLLGHMIGIYLPL